MYNVTIHCCPAKTQKNPKSVSPKPDKVRLRTFLLKNFLIPFYLSDRKRDKTKGISKFRRTQRPVKKHYLVCGKALTRVKIPSSAFAKSITCFLSASAAGRRKGLAPPILRGAEKAFVG